MEKADIYYLSVNKFVDINVSRCFINGQISQIHCFSAYLKPEFFPFYLVIVHLRETYAKSD